MAGFQRAADSGLPLGSPVERDPPAGGERLRFRGRAACLRTWGRCIIAPRSHCLDIDIDYGFYQIAKNNYYPGWHQQISCNEYLMNKAAYDALPESYRAMIGAAATEQVVHTYAETEAANPKAMLEMQEKYGVTNRRWTDETLATLERHWLAVLEEEAAKDPTWKKISESYLGWRKLYRIWGDAQALNGSYQ